MQTRVEFGAKPATDVLDPGNKLVFSGAGSGVCRVVGSSTKDYSVAAGVTVGPFLRSTNVTVWATSGSFDVLEVAADDFDAVFQAPVSGAGKLVLPALGKPLCLGMNAASGCTASNAALTYTSRVSPNGQRLMGVKVTSNGGATTNCSVDIPIPVPSTIPNGRVALLMYVPPATAALGVGMTLYVGDSGFSAFMSRNTTIASPGWGHYCPIPPNGVAAVAQKFAASGGAAFGTTSFAKGRVRFDYAAGQAPEFEVYALVEDCGPAQAPINFIFDDGYAEQYTLAAPILERYGLRGSFAVIADAIGTSGVYMTWDQCRDLRDRGHEINVHGPIGGNGSLLNYATAAEAAADVSFHRNLVIANGCNVNGSANCYVWPQGNNAFANGDTSIVDAVTALGIKCARGVDNTREDSLLPWGSRMLMYQSIVGHAWASEGTEVANIAAIQQRVVDNVAAKRPSVFMLHYLTTGTPTQSLQIKTANFELLCQTAAAQIATGAAVNVTMTGLHYIATGTYPV